jgi:hypothetical protein
MRVKTIVPCTHDPLESLARTEELYDKYQNSLQPLSPERAEAGRLFKQLLASLHTAHAADIPFDLFRREVITRCREYLRKNKAP